MLDREKKLQFSYLLFLLRHFLESSVEERIQQAHYDPNTADHCERTRNKVAKVALLPRHFCHNRREVVTEIYTYEYTTVLVRHNVTDFKQKQARCASKISELTRVTNGCGQLSATRERNLRHEPYDIPGKCQCLPPGTTTSVCEVAEY